MTPGKGPGRAGTRHGELHKGSTAILPQRRACANCGTPLYPGELRYCKPCRANLALYHALQDMRGLES